MDQAALIAIDWGTTFARAYAVDSRGAIVETRERPLGVQQLGNGDFPQALRTLLGDWHSLPLPRIASGMIGSRQGWIEVPYLTTPAAAEALADHLAWTPQRELAIVPGLITRDDDGTPDVMRGEETQLVGAVDASDPVMLAVLPGTHSKWVRVERGQVVGFKTFMTGELYAVLLANSILGRLADREHAPEEPGPAFARGVARGLADDGLSHQIFGARTLALAGELAQHEVPDWLSGVLIGHEIRSAREWVRRQGADATECCVIGTDALFARYAAALAQSGMTARRGPPDAAVRGLVRIADRARPMHFH
jgi:2-dehydro-3-deoxygalactonokinase